MKVIGYAMYLYIYIYLPDFDEIFIGLPKLFFSKKNRVIIGQNLSNLLSTFCTHEHGVSKRSRINKSMEDIPT
jgi:hypothetical protein